MKKITVAIIGAPNVGKSTLFNRIIGKRHILENARAGTTRDQHEDTTAHNDTMITFIDSGGWNPSHTGIIESQMLSQTRDAMKRADMILVIFDGKAGITALDKVLMDTIRKEKKPVLYAVNKLDSELSESQLCDFYALGADDLIPISAIHKKNIDLILDAIVSKSFTAAPQTDDSSDSCVRLSFIGRPNTGKSTLINALCGKNRVIVSAEPGTTRDATIVKLRYKASSMNLIDTPGMRRKKKSSTGIEGLMRMHAEKAVVQSDIAGLIIDASEGITAGDIRIAQCIRDAHRACFILLNKWDIVPHPDLLLPKLMSLMSQKLSFMRWAPVLSISAKTGLRINRILPLAEVIYQRYTAVLNVKKLSALVSGELYAHPLVWKHKPIIIKNIHQIKTAPPTLKLEIHNPEMLHFSHIRFIENTIRTHFQLEGTPVIFT